MDKLDKVVGGYYNDQGYLMTTIAYSCQYWYGLASAWMAVRGQCGSCGYWFWDRFLGLLGVPGDCRNPHNRREDRINLKGDL